MVQSENTEFTVFPQETAWKRDRGLPDNISSVGLRAGSLPVAKEPKYKTEATLKQIQ